MFSGLTENINKVKKLSDAEKADLKESIYYHHETCRQYLIDNPNVSIVIKNALEDRMITLSQALNKL
jgi:hypothetical protein